MTVDPVTQARIDLLVAQAEELEAEAQAKQALADVAARRAKRLRESPSAPGG